MEVLLRQFYKLHNPKKIKDIPRILGHYKGADKLLIENLRRKYNEPEPAALLEWVVVDFSDATEEKKNDQPRHDRCGECPDALRAPGQDRGGPADSKVSRKYKQA